jgi:hypothetical protein
LTRILFVGQKPETVDFSDPALPPGSTAALRWPLRRSENADGKPTCMITPDEAGRAMLEKH